MIALVQRLGPAVVGLAVVAGFGASLAGAQPTTVDWANTGWLILLGAGSVVAASRAPVRALVAMGVIAALAGLSGGGVAVLVGWATLAAVVAVHARPNDDGPRRLLAALVGLFAMTVLLMQGAWGFHGAPTLASLAALGPVWWCAGRRLLRPGVWYQRSVRPGVRHRRRARPGDRFRRRPRPGVRYRRRQLTRAHPVLIAVVVAPVMLLVVAIGLSLWAASEVQASVASARDGRTGDGTAQLHRARVGFSTAHFLTRFPLAPARLIPVVSQHMDLLDRSTSDGAAVAGAGHQVLEAGSYDGFKGRNGQIDLDRVRSLVDPVEQTEARLSLARRRMARTSSPWLLAPVQTRLENALVQLDQVIEEADMIGEAARIVPDMLGGNGERVWFLAFLNPSEERGGGGFLGSYAELRALDGRIEMTRSGSVIDLIAAAPAGTRTITGPADYLQRYGRYQPADFFQDLTYSPHFPYTADVISQLYPQSGGTDLDGVISVDPYTLAAMLKITGPIEVEGLDGPLTAKNAARTILKDQYVNFDAQTTGDQTARRDVLNDAASKTFRALLDGALPAPRTLGDALAPMVQQRRLQMFARRPVEQRLIERLGMDGAMAADEAGDYLMVSHQNRGNSKIDAFLVRSTTYDAVVDPATGRVEATATIKMHNQAPASGLPDYVIGNARGEPSGSNVMTLSVYSHLAAQGATVDGEPIGLIPGTEAGARVVSMRLVVPPKSTSTVVVRLAGEIEIPAGGYRLRVVPQATVITDRLSIEVRTNDPDREPIARRQLATFGEPEVLGDGASDE